MATRVRAKPDLLYDQDFYAWSRQQAALLRDRRFAELDLEHLIEKVDDLGGALKRSVRRRIGTIIEHLLKLEHSPAEPPTLCLQTAPSHSIRLSATGCRSSEQHQACNV